MLCADTDLLRWEPRLAIDASCAAQTLFDGRGRLRGRQLALIGDPLPSDDAIVVIGDACYAGSRGLGATLLTIGPAALGIAVTMPSDGDVACSIRTFAAHRALVSSIVSRTCGLDAGRNRSADATLLRRPCALGTLHLIYASLAAATLDEHADWLVRAELYGRLFRRSVRAAYMAVDEEGDGLAERSANQEVA